MNERSLRPLPASGRRRRARGRRLAVAAALPLGFAPLAACAPKVQVEPPKEPITINLNIKLDADVRLKVEEGTLTTVSRFEVTGLEALSAKQRRKLLSELPPKPGKPFLEARADGGLDARVKHPAAHHFGNNAGGLN